MPAIQPKPNRTVQVHVVSALWALCHLETVPSRWTVLHLDDSGPAGKELVRHLNRGITSMSYNISLPPRNEPGAQDTQDTAPSSGSNAGSCLDALDTRLADRLVALNEADGFKCQVNACLYLLLHACVRLPSLPALCALRSAVA